MAAQLAPHTNYGCPVGAHSRPGARKWGHFPGGAAAPQPLRGRRARRGAPLQHLGQLPRRRAGGRYTRVRGAASSPARRQQPAKSHAVTVTNLYVSSAFPLPPPPARGTEQVGGEGEGWVIILPRSSTFGGLGCICTAGFSCGLAQKTHFSFLSWDTFEKLKFQTAQVKNEQRERNIRETKLKENKMKVDTCFFASRSGTRTTAQFICAFFRGSNNRAWGQTTRQPEGKYSSTSWQDALAEKKRKIYNLSWKQDRLWLRN